ncbi:hypothetical protein H8D36_03330 [archaeon]|nr:hypothetical protein [archaeon]
MIDLVIVSDARDARLNQLTDTCLWSAHNSGRKIVIESQDIVFEGITTVPQPKPFNYNKCLNLGFKYTENDICFANNDVDFTACDWEKVEELLETYPSLCVAENNAHHGFMADKVYHGYKIGYHLTGWCIFLKRWVFEKIGGFNTDVDMWFSDDIYAEQLQKAGIKHHIYMGTIIEHNASSTLGQKDNEFYESELVKFLKAKQKLWCNFNEDVAVKYLTLQRDYNQLQNLMEYLKDENEKGELEKWGKIGEKIFNFLKNIK